MRIILQIIKWSGAVMLSFSIAFLLVTWICDEICKHSSYYQDAQQDMVIMDD